MDTKLKNYIERWFPDEEYNEELITAVYNYGVKQATKVPNDNILTHICKMALEWYTNRKVFVIPNNLLIHIKETLKDMIYGEDTVFRD